uniref:Inner membrane protein n=1 Tax=Heterorhabditis bacteriophora TaxID=37862 RepID=A0A1I7WBS8_HETBA
MNILLMAAGLRAESRLEKLRSEQYILKSLAASLIGGSVILAATEVVVSFCTVIRDSSVLPLFIFFLTSLRSVAYPQCDDLQL